MANLLTNLNNPETWQEYLEYKRSKNFLHKNDEKALVEFIYSHGYEQAAARIINGAGLSVPVRKQINKLGGKKRVVYTFAEDENMVLKLLAYLLYRYDNKHSTLCYSFRKGFGARKAIYKLVNTPGINDMWCYKLDIKNYFNSINVPFLLPMLGVVIDDDEPLLKFFAQMLSGDEAISEDEIIRGSRGVMAGTPTSPFLANVYLRQIDKYFCDNDILYARYSDDIIVFAQSREVLSGYKDYLYEHIAKLKLEINDDKENIISPGEPWEYLGVEYCNGEIDLSKAAMRKIKGKIKRKARALLRWKIRKNATDEQAMKVMIRAFNRKFFESRDAHDLTWSRWFFPLITTKDSLGEIDAYLQQYIRYIATGCFGKQNYRVTYGNLKKLGYRSLVSEYYKCKSDTGGQSPCGAVSLPPFR